MTKCQQCSKFGKPNHFARVCQSSYSSSSFNANQQQIHELEHQSNGSSFTPNHNQPFIPSPNQIDINELFIDHVSNSNTTPAQNEILAKLNINDQIIEFKVDTRAQCNVIPFPIFNQTKLSHQFETAMHFYVHMEAMLSHSSVCVQ